MISRPHRLAIQGLRHQLIPKALEDLLVEPVRQIQRTFCSCGKSAISDVRCNAVGGTRG